MKKALLLTLLIAYCTTCDAHEKYEENPRYKKKCHSSCASRESSVLSIMGWGIGLFAGIAILCSLIDNNPDPTTTRNTQ